MKSTLSARKQFFFLSSLLALVTFFQLFSGVAAAASKPVYDPNQPQYLHDKNLYAESAVLMEQHSGRILYDMKGNQKMQPASITKVLTMLLALENANLDDKVTVGKEIGQIPGDSSRCGLIQGETLTLEDLLYGLMIKSGNDAAMTIAVHVGGSVDNFVSMMNDKAKALGCQNSRFANPHGYEDKNHYTTARDFALIARAGMDNSVFREIANTRKHVIPKNNKRSQALTLTSTSPFVSGNSSLAHYYQYGTGIKTGYFTAAKHTFVGSASKNGVDLIAVILKTTKEGKWIDAKRLMEYGFAVSETVRLADLYNSAPVSLPVMDSSGLNPTGETLRLELDSSGKAFSFADATDHLRGMRNQFDGYYVYSGPRTVSGPISAGAVIGTLQFYPQEGNPSLSFNLVAAQDIGLNIGIPGTGYLPPLDSLVPALG